MEDIIELPRKVEVRRNGTEEKFQSGKEKNDPLPWSVVPFSSFLLKTFPMTILNAQFRRWENTMVGKQRSSQNPAAVPVLFSQQ